MGPDDPLERMLAELQQLQDKVSALTETHAKTAASVEEIRDTTGSTLALVEALGAPLARRRTSFVSSAMSAGSSAASAASAAPAGEAASAEGAASPAPARAGCFRPGEGAW